MATPPIELQVQDRVAAYLSCDPALTALLSAFPTRAPAAGTIGSVLAPGTVPVIVRGVVPDGFAQAESPLVAVEVAEEQIQVATLGPSGTARYFQWITLGIVAMVYTSGAADLESSKRSLVTVTNQLMVSVLKLRQDPSPGGVRLWYDLRLREPQSVSFMRPALPDSQFRRAIIAAQFRTYQRFP